MKRDLVKYIIFCIVLLPLELVAASKILVLEPKGDLPAIAKSIDKLIREKLGSKAEFSLVDYKETLRFIYESELGLYPQPLEKAFNLLKEEFADSTFVIWTNIQYLRFTMARKMFIKAAVKGELRIHLTIYETTADTILYSEDIISLVNKNRGFIFFSSPDDAIPLSAIEKERLIEELIENSVDKIVSAIIASVNKKSTDSTQVKDSTVTQADSSKKK
ncbi:MAG: hypothetical protein N2053_08410 [Chitinispirillaceae bacterium]|nr:hypothetical protein [Chitinispirillaceae bacterium]